MINFYENRVIWLTGASKGIGRALALELASRKAVLAITARDEAELNLVKQSLGAVRCGVYPGDVSQLSSMKEIYSRIVHELGPVDILIANAGNHILSEPRAFNADEYFSLMKTNYGGLLNCMQAVIPSMIERKRGHIVGLSSMAGYRGMPTAAAYGASKSAIAVFLESARFHLAEAGIITTIVYPGFVRTPLTDKNNFHMPFLIEADQAAKTICNGIAKQRKEISFPFPFNWIMNLSRIIPYPIYEMILGKIWKKAFPN